MHDAFERLQFYDRYEAKKGRFVVLAQLALFVYGIPTYRPMNRVINSCHCLQTFAIRLKSYKRRWQPSRRTPLNRRLMVRIPKVTCTYDFLNYVPTFVNKTTKENIEMKPACRRTVYSLWETCDVPNCIWARE